MTKEALKLALEALVNTDSEPSSKSWKREIEAITAIKEALAQPEQDWIERERAVGYREGHQNALKQMAQPEQEPVGEVGQIDIDEDGVGYAWFTIATDGLELGDKLYHTPPQRKPLTDEEIIQVASTPAGAQATTKGYVIPFARAIEAAHGIKGEV